MMAIMQIGESLSSKCVFPNIGEIDLFPQQNLLHLFNKIPWGVFRFQDA